MQIYTNRYDKLLTSLFRGCLATSLVIGFIQCDPKVNNRIIKLETGEATSITTSTATLGGNIIDLGGATVEQFGHCWSTSSDATLNNSVKDLGIARYTGNYTSSLTDLISDMTYYYKAFAVCGDEVTYGEEKSFTTQNGIIELTTGDYSEVTSSSFKMGGDVLSDGGSPVTDKGICWNTAPGPTTDNFTESGGNGIGSFMVSISGLVVNTTYYLRAYATNSVGTWFSDEVEVTLWLNEPGPDVTDVEGNNYNSKRIGTQVWLVQNLKTTKYVDGISIPHVTNANTWMNLTSAAYSWYENDIINRENYGALYNWHSVNTGKLCPAGWHVPSKEEYILLEEYLKSTGGDAGGMMKHQGTSQWNTPNTGATNVSGLTGLPAGYRGVDDGDFWGQHYALFLWTSTEDVNDNATAITLVYDNASMGEGVYNRVLGASVRCVQDP